MRDCRGRRRRMRVGIRVNRPITAAGLTPCLSTKRPEIGPRKRCGPKRGMKRRPDWREEKPKRYSTCKGRVASKMARSRG